MAVLWIVVGLVVLTVGADVFVRGATGLARAVGMPSLIIGLTVVAFGTSAPEFAVSVKAGLTGQGDIAVGNVLGSNTFNVLFILGISALIVPLAVSSQLVRLDVPVMIGASILVWVLSRDGAIGRFEGAALMAVLCAYTGLLIYLGKRQPPLAVNEEAEPPSTPVPKRLAWSVLLLLVGLGLLVVGADRLVHGAVALARLMGVSELVIGLTIVAVGTSLPEVATSIVASIRGQRDIAVGNVIGSNVFNLLGVLGSSALLASGGISVAEPALRFDVPVMLAVAVVCLPIFFTGARISRWEGVLFLGYYATYVVFLILTAMHHAALASLGMAMLWFVIPMTLLGIVVSVVAWLRRRQPSRAGTHGVETPQ